MEYLNNFIITLVATMIFMTAIEIIAPDNSMKKYIKFVLGLILISVMINPIIKFFTGGEQEVINRIKGYEDMLNLGVTNEGESKEVIEKGKVFQKYFFASLFIDIDETHQKIFKETLELMEKNIDCLLEEK